MTDAGGEVVCDPVESARGLRPDEVAYYHERGYLRIDGLISRDFAARLLESAKQKLRLHEEAQAGNFNQNLKGFRKALWDNLPEVRANEGLLGTFSRSPGLATVHAQVLLFPRPVRHFMSQLLIKRPATTSGSKTPWHQDFPYASLDRTDRPALWIALTDMPAQRGTLRFLEGSHRFGGFGRMLDEPDHDLRTRYPTMFDRLVVSAPFDLKAGDATIHHPLTVHSAPENETEEPRWTFLSQFIAADTLFTGSRPFVLREFEELEPGKPFDHPSFPVIPARV